MRFQKGNPGGPGRPKEGRSKALAVLDTICGKPKNLKKLREVLQTEFDRDTLNFFREFVIPLLPKQVATALNDTGYATMTPAQVAAQMDEATIGTPPVACKEKS